MKPKHLTELCRKMTNYFAFYEGFGAPSFEKFAGLMSLKLSDLATLRSEPEFDRAYRECSAIRRDFLVDRALEKRFDPSFVKFLLTLEREESEEAAATQLSLRVEVTE